MASESEIEPVNNYGRTREAAESERRRHDASGSSRGVPHGRYDRRRHDTRLPAGGVAVPPKPQRGALVLGAVTDPWGSPSGTGTQRIEVAINSQVDLLEKERSHGRISEAAYCAGRLAQAVFERLGQISGTNWAGASRIDARTAQVHAIVRALIGARAIDALEEQLRGRLGMIDARLLRRILGDRLSYDECAGLQGKSGDRGQRYVAMRFRDALETLAEAWVGRGKVIPAPDDKHRAASLDMEARQARSIAVGKAKAAGEAKGNKALEDGQRS